MRRSKVHAASVRLDVPLYMRVEKIAKADCRSVAQLLRKVVTDFVEQAETDKSARVDRARRRDAAYSGVTGQFPRPFH